MSTEYFVSDRGNVSPAMGWEELKRLWKTGAFSTDAVVKTNNLDGWFPLATFMRQMGGETPALATEFYVSVDGESAGPYTINQLRSMWSAGRLNGSMQFSIGGDWQPLSSLVDALEGKATAPAPASQGPDSSSRAGAAILSLFLPWLGMALVGEVGIGVVMFIVTCIGYAFFVVPGLALHVVGVVVCATWSGKEH